MICGSPATFETPDALCCLPSGLIPPLQSTASSHCPLGSSQPGTWISKGFCKHVVLSLSLSPCVSPFRYLSLFLTCAPSHLASCSLWSSFSLSSCALETLTPPHFPFTSLSQGNLSDALDEVPGPLRCPYIPSLQSLAHCNYFINHL